MTHSIADGIHRRRLEGRGHIIGICFADHSGRKPFHSHAHRGLEAREGKVASGPALHGPRERKTFGVPGARRAFDGGAAGITKAEHLCDFIKGLAGRIVHRGAEAAVASDAIDAKQLTMPARNQKQKKREGDLIGKARRERVAFEMIDGDERNFMHRRDHLGRHDAHEHAADQTWTRGGAHGIEIGKAHAGLGHGFCDEAVEMGEMGARGDLGHDAAEDRMLLHLAEHGVREHLAASVDDGGGGLVTAGFDA